MTHHPRPCRLLLAGGTAVLALTAAACSGEPAAPPTVASVAALAGATQVTPASPELYVAREASGVVRGRDVTIYTFATQANHQAWDQAAASFGPPAVVKSGPLYEVVWG